MTIVGVGCCRICGCTDATPCVVGDWRHGETRTFPCSWLDRERTLCSNPLCVARVPLAELEQMVFMGEEGQRL